MLLRFYRPLARDTTTRVPETPPNGMTLQDLMLLIECSRERDWDLQVVYLPP
jgi:hypothetical protein